MSGSSSTTTRTCIGVSVLVTRVFSFSGRELFEILHLAFELDHLQLTSDGQPLEPLELGQSVKLLGLLRELGLGQLLFRHVAGRGVEAELAKQAKELDRLAELERFQRLAIGRELKMIELKREMEYLKQFAPAEGEGSRDQY